MLYELLTGRTPFAGPPAVVIATVLTAEPDPPRKHRADVPKDLETICLKAMAKRPEDRYAGCQELADDLRRWLEGEPISARRMSLYERAARWVQKEPVLTGGAAVTTILFAVSFILITAFARRANTAWQQAETTLAQADQNAATARVAEMRATDALAEAQTARAGEKRVMGERNGALGTSAEERKRGDAEQRRGDSLQKTIEEQRKTIEEQTKTIVALQSQLRAQ